MNKKLLLLVFTLIATLASAASISPEEVEAQPREQVEKRLPDSHPMLYYVYANRLFTSGQKDAAVTWFYLGQLRYRFHLAANPNLPPDRDPALLASLNASIGATINGYAGGSAQGWAKQINEALALDDKLPNNFTPKAANQAKLDTVREGLVKLRETILQNADTLRAQREKAGLENR